MRKGSGGFPDYFALEQRFRWGGVWNTSQFHHFDVFCQTQRPQHAYCVPGHVDFPRSQTMPRGLGERMMVVVPAFAEGKQADPPAIGGEVVFQLKVFIAKSMGG